GRLARPSPGAGGWAGAGPLGYGPAHSVVQVLQAFPARLVFAIMQALPVPRAHHRELEDVTWLESVALLAPLHLHPRFVGLQQVCEFGVRLQRPQYHWLQLYRLRSICQVPREPHRYPRVASHRCDWTTYSETLGAWSCLLPLRQAHLAARRSTRRRLQKFEEYATGIRRIARCPGLR